VIGTMSNSQSDFYTAMLDIPMLLCARERSTPSYRLGQGKMQ
jgi:hypothetical protein